VYKCTVDAGLAGEAISVTNAYRTPAASTAPAMFHGSAPVSKDGADSSAIKVSRGSQIQSTSY